MFLLLLHAGHVGAQDGRGAPGPTLVCDSPVHDFGRKDNEETVFHTFVLRNTGDLAAGIRTMSPCCGSSFSLSRDRIEPGGTVDAKVSLSLRGRSGEQKKSFYVRSDAAAGGMLELKLVGVALAKMEVRPTAVIMSTASNIPAFGMVEILCDTGTVFAVTGIVSTATSFTAACRSESRRHVVTISTVPPLGRGVNRGIVRVLTDHPRFSAIDIPVAARVAADLVAIPDEVILPMEDKPLPVRRFAMLKSKNRRDFQVLSAESPDPAVKITWDRLSSDGWRVQMENLVPDEQLDGKSITIRTDHPEAKEVVLTIKVIKRSSK